MPRFSGIIHGDFNEQNILVQRKATATYDQYCVHGVIDFGDMHKSYYVFELAILLCYMMLECIKVNLDPLEGSGFALAGYMTKWKVSSFELKLLRVSFTCSLVNPVETLAIRT